MQVLYAYDEAGRVLTELSVNTGTGAKNGVEYLYLDGVMVAAQAFTIPAGQAAQYVGIFNVHTDHLDTPRLVTNPQNVARWMWLSEPFGMLPANENPAGLGVFPFSTRFPGQVIDKETNLHYNYFRDYDPAIGRYVESDPLGLAGGINTYAYVRGNPLSFADPLGLQATGGSGSQSSGGSAKNQNCQGPDCKQSYFDCLANCIRTNDPLNDPAKLGLTALGGTFPKSWVGLPQGLGGASPVTTVPSAAAYASGGGPAGTAGAVARGVGRVFSPIWIGYGLGMVAVETMCAIACAQDACMY